MDSDEHGQRTTLARCSMCQVEHCADCDVVHVHVGHASVRLTMSGFLAMCATLLEAARTAAQQADPGALLPRPRTGLQ
jgi:hypothetical protein